MSIPNTMEPPAGLASLFGKMGRVWRQAPASFRIGGIIVFAHLFIAVTGPFWAPFDQATIGAGPPLAEMSWAHPFGTDLLGRDVFSRVIHGALMVILMSLSGTFLGVATGTALGLMSAYLRGWFDEVVMRLIEALISIPYLVLALLIRPRSAPDLRSRR